MKKIFNVFRLGGSRKSKIPIVIGRSGLPHSDIVPRFPLAAGEAGSGEAYGGSGLIFFFRL